jgi:hypothetical protein
MRFRLLLVGALLGFAPGAAAQVSVRAPGGTLSGVVRDSMTGRPVGFALVVAEDRGGEQRVFAGESGRFALTGLAPGIVRLRVQQIGYRPVRLSVRLIGPGEPGSAGLEVELARQAILLPELVVEGDVCTGARELANPAEGALLQQIFANAERMLTLQQDYPFRETYQQATTVFDSIGNLRDGRLDTTRYDSRTMTRYRRGSVITRERSGGESALYFQATDLAQEDFRRHHCFWYAGRDTTDGRNAYRVRFAPLRRVRSIDWAGELLIDSTRLTLVRSDAYLVNLPPRGTQFESGTCTVAYREVVPTLVTPSQARCVTRRRSVPPVTSVFRWVLIDFRFLGRRPDQPPPGSP